ncbi:54f9547b-9125-4e7a-91b6-2d71424b7ecd [Thermothielavioides terrestris]|uniref:54f9547b-9125-4e7a-91b6-2d71424b7ecd n=1 Tax=Thermothielavioides terrestris TaxID=2587410 RepID=A0A3S4C5H0_9PEZI|nr:54f9547b-9125-4e7a-91b6-2d71424b7ecd [Thermothielavioides terrestris]
MAAARAGEQPFQEGQAFLDGQFDIVDWYPYFQSCVRYFLKHAQYNGPVQFLAAFINIQLPFQKAQAEFLLSHTPSPAAVAAAAAAGLAPPPAAPPPPPPAALGGGGVGVGVPLTYSTATTTTLQPYIRRLVATGFDFPGVLHSFFGDDWERGVRPLCELERRNYMFAAKSGSWLEVKRAYDGAGADEAVPFLRPLRNVSEAEIVAAEAAWRC